MRPVCRCSRHPTAAATSRVAVCCSRRDPRPLYAATRPILVSPAPRRRRTGHTRECGAKVPAVPLPRPLCLSGEAPRSDQPGTSPLMYAIDWMGTMYGGYMKKVSSCLEFIVVDRSTGGWDTKKWKGVLGKPKKSPLVFGGVGVDELTIIYLLKMRGDHPSNRG